MIFSSPSAIHERTDGMPIPFIKNSLFLVSTFHLRSESLSDYRAQCICLPASWKYTLIYWLSKRASSYGALLSAATPTGATLLARRFAAVAQSFPRRIFCIFSRKNRRSSSASIDPPTRLASYSLSPASLSLSLLYSRVPASRDA